LSERSKWEKDVVESAVKGVVVAAAMKSSRGCGALGKVEDRIK